MSKKMIKILSVVLTIAIVLTTLTTSAFAAETLKPSDITANTNGASTGVTEIQNLGGRILGAVQAVGVVVAVVIVLVLGIKYMMGSASEKAEYKKTMIPYLIGAVLIFAAPTIVNIVYEFATGMEG